MCLGGLKWVVLGNRVGRSVVYVNVDWGELAWVETDTLCKTVRLHINIGPALRVGP